MDACDKVLDLLEIDARNWAIIHQIILNGSQEVIVKIDSLFDLSDLLEVKLIILHVVIVEIKSALEGLKDLDAAVIIVLTIDVEVEQDSE